MPALNEQEAAEAGSGGVHLAPLVLALVYVGTCVLCGVFVNSIVKNIEIHTQIPIRYSYNLNNLIDIDAY